jgi:hypothetical protein
MRVAIIRGMDGGSLELAGASHSGRTKMDELEWIGSTSYFVA